MPINLTEKEIDILTSHSGSLQRLIDHHVCMEVEGEAMGFDCSYHRKRQEELQVVKDALEEPDEWR